VSSVRKNIIIVMPCYKEEASLPHTIAEVDAVRSQLTSTYNVDVLLVNDGSPDKTQDVIEAVSEKYPYVYYRQFSKNVGHQSALRAGLNASTAYDAVIMMDADLQHPPKLIPKMLEEWEKGSKIVQMLRDDSHDDVGVARYFAGKFYYWMINAISDIKLEYGASDFRLIDKSVTKTVASSKENNLFLRGYFSWLPVSRTAIEYIPSKRIAGASNYTLRKLLQLSYNSILQFSEKPLRISVGIGMFMSVLSFLYGIYIMISHFFGTTSVSGWTSLMTVTLFCFGINFILIGIIGHYLGHATGLLKQRPEYVITKEKLRFEE
jgi:polyisoprenyl-phosphate glycosyltransferase